MSKDNLCIDKNERMWKNENGKSLKTFKGKQKNKAQNLG